MLFSAEEPTSLPQEDMFIEGGQGAEQNGERSGVNVVVRGRRIDSNSGAESEHADTAGGRGIMANFRCPLCKRTPVYYALLC